MPLKSLLGSLTKFFGIFSTTVEFPWDIEKKHLFSCAGFAVIGVALMVGILFFLMIAVERTFEWLGNQISKIFGFRKKSKDPEDPAALVGSFKRYKN